MLDEPTNDLDLETLDLLQEMLADYAGTVLLVSHDRDFLDRVVTSIIVAEGDGRWVEYAGGYTDMLAQRGPAPTPSGERPRPAPAPSGPAARPPSRKLSFKDKHALETPAGANGRAAGGHCPVAGQARGRRPLPQRSCRLPRRDGRARPGRT